MEKLVVSEDITRDLLVKDNNFDTEWSPRSTRTPLEFTGFNIVEPVSKTVLRPLPPVDTLLGRQISLIVVPLFVGPLPFPPLFESLHLK